MPDFSQHFGIIYKKYCELALEMGLHGRDIHRLGMAKFLGATQGRMIAWQRGQWPNAQDIAAIADKLGLSYRWLVTGEGDPEGEDAPQRDQPAATSDLKFNIKMENFSQHFETIYNKFMLTAQERGLNTDSKLALARYLGVSHGKMQAWEKGQWPSAQDLANIGSKLGFNLRWLVTGEGDPESKDVPPQQEQPAATPKKFAATPALPLMGFAGCSGDGLDMVMPFAMAVSPVILGPRTIAVVASGDSMIPAGIANGHTCFCDPDQEALPGEAVFIRQTDGKGALKVYRGPSEDKEGFTAFQGWMPKDDHGRQRSVTLEIADSFIDFIAPVVLVRRRA